MQLLDNIQTFQLLDDANLYEDDRKPILALWNDINFQTMQIDIK